MHTSAFFGEVGNTQLPVLLTRPHLKTHLKRIVAHLDETQYDVVQEACEQMGWSLSSANWDLKWVDSAVTIDALAKMHPHQKTNHFPGMSGLARKNNLEKNLARMKAISKQDYDFSPKTFLMPFESGKLRVYCQEAKKQGLRKTFIVKPQAGCQGRGIFLTQHLSEIQTNEHCVVQEYLEQPLLYKGLKFDLRVYALVAGCDPLRLYIYNQGLVRFATEQYEQPEEYNLDDLYMHLTNYAINKDSPKYVFNDSLHSLSHGHKKSLAQFFQTLKNLGHPAQEYWADVKDIIVKTLIAGQPQLEHDYRAAQPHNFPNDMCFQILGFDFIFDDSHKCYLLEVNHSPSFTTETPLDHLIKYNLIRDTLHLLNITPQAKAETTCRASDEINRRVFTGKCLKVSTEERIQLVRYFQEIRNSHERAHLGSFERIYPCKNTNRQATYEQLLLASQIDYKRDCNPLKYRIKRVTVNSTVCEDSAKIKPKRYDSKATPITPQATKKKERGLSLHHSGSRGQCTKCEDCPQCNDCRYGKNCEEGTLFTRMIRRYE